MDTGEKYQPVRKEDIQMGQVLGRGNGGFVY
jgi:serine/threonine protein kinase